MDLAQAVAIARRVVQLFHMNDRISFKDWVWNSNEFDLD